uniref:Predicted protein n=1 Tax=Hordeum vulgare subsp. vulgare TaxID=112509 RepID=F2DTQ7_HORVV|nr:predicted protein [Hordeum vulgare subsp. vulgare]
MYLSRKPLIIHVWEMSKLRFLSFSKPFQPYNSWKILMSSLYLKFISS